MKTSISSEALSQLGPRKSCFPQNLTYGQTDIRTDISNYRVASLLKIGGRGQKEKSRKNNRAGKQGY